MIELFLRGGLVFMLPLLGASIVVVAIAIERTIRFRRARLAYDPFLFEMRRVIHQQGVAAARHLAETTPGPVARVWREGLLAHRLPLPLIRERMEAIALQETARLERHLSHLSILGQVAPLVGILGTVWGMIATFRVLEGGLGAGGGIEGALLVGGIWQALITTVGGLVVAIPALLVHHWLCTRVDGFLEEMERSIADLVSCLIPSRVRAPGAGVSERVAEAR